MRRQVDAPATPSRPLPADWNRAADEALLGLTDVDLREQAEAIRSGARYVLRARVT